MVALVLPQTLILLVTPQGAEMVSGMMYEPYEQG